MHFRRFLCYSENWSDFSQFKMKISADRLTELRQIVGNVPESFVISSETSIRHIAPGELNLQEAAFQKGQLVVVKAPKRSGADFWLAEVLYEIDDTMELTYKLKYWDEKVNKKGIYKPHGTYCTLPHADILFGPIELNADHSIPIHFMRHIADALNRDLQTQNTEAS